MESIIAVGVGVVVGGGILTLVYRILWGERDQARVDAELRALARPPASKASSPSATERS